MSTEEPIFGAILSRPCAAHEAGSSSVASTSLGFLILNTRLASNMSAHETALPRAKWNTGISAVLGKAAVHRHAMRLEVLAKQLLASPTVETFAAQLRVVGTDAFAKCEAFDLGAHSGYHANSLVAFLLVLLHVTGELGGNGTRNERKLQAVQKSVHAAPNCFAIFHQGLQE